MLRCPSACSLYIIDKKHLLAITVLFCGLPDSKTHVSWRSPQHCHWFFGFFFWKTKNCTQYSWNYFLLMCWWWWFYDARVHCQESGEESSEVESVYSLKCHISQEVNHLSEGLKHVSSINLEIASFLVVQCRYFLTSGFPTFRHLH